MPTPISTSEIHESIRMLKANDAYSQPAYASLLRIALSPHLFSIAEKDVTLILSALRSSEMNPTYRQVLVLLSDLAPINA